MATNQSLPPPFDLTKFLADGNEEDCIQIVDILKQYGCIILKDPRVSLNVHEDYLNLMEQYYEQPVEKKMEDAKPLWGYHTGVTPPFLEGFDDYNNLAQEMEETDKPHFVDGPDPKWRFSWRLGKATENPKYKHLDRGIQNPVIPSSFPSWKEINDRWGAALSETGFTVAKMIAIGLNLPPNTFVDLLSKGSRIVPSGSDLKVYGKLGTVLAYGHWDQTIFTLHGKSRFPGLTVWAPQGQKQGKGEVLALGKKIQSCSIPDGDLLLQTGRQLEWLTGGVLKAGFHEVVVNCDTKAAMKRAAEEKRSLWRVSSTMVVYVPWDYKLQPLEPFLTEENSEIYPTMYSGDHFTDFLQRKYSYDEGEEVNTHGIY